MDNVKDLPTLLQLNDDCLYNIFNKLTIQEQLQLTRTCERFCMIIKHMIWRLQFRETCTVSTDTDKLDINEYQELFHHVVEYIEKFTVADNKHLVFTSYLGRYTRRPELAFYLCSQFPCLTHFECLDTSLHDGLLRLVAENCPKLKVLKLRSAYITGAHIKDIQKLRQLYLPECSLKSEHLDDIFKHLDLTHLDIVGANVQVISYTKQSWSKLKYLKLSEALIEVDALRKCGNLQHLQCLIIDNLCKDGRLTPHWHNLFRRVAAKVAKLCMLNSDVTAAMYAFADNAILFTELHTLFVKGTADARTMSTLAWLPALIELQLHSYKELSPAVIIDFVATSKHLERVQLVCIDTLFGQSVEQPVHIIYRLLELIDILRKQRGRKPVCINVVHSDLTICVEEISRIRMQVMQDSRYLGQKLLQITFNVPPMEYKPSLDSYVEMHFTDVLK